METAIKGMTATIDATDVDRAITAGSPSVIKPKPRVAYGAPLMLFSP